jgi:hypothetical protein
MTFAHAPELRRLTDLDDAWKTKASGARITAVRAAAERVRDRIASSPRALCVRTFDQATLIYPTKFAFGGTALSPAPFVVMTHRAMLVQFLQRGEPKTLLFNPSDVVGARRTPYFASQIDTFGDRVADFIAGKFEPLESQLARIGIAPGDVDYVAFDHFHTQDVRSLVGTEDGAFLPRFPRAKLLAPANEWAEWDDLPPFQRPWFVADGKRGARRDHVVMTDGDLELGDGVWIFRTPGHTVGNQTLFVSTDSGIWGTSENGTCVDAWSALDSRIPGVARTCRHNGTDVALNWNTPENAVDQYASMMLERTLASRVKTAPAFVQMLSSSEVTPSLLAPGIRPTLVFGGVSSGTPVRGVKRAEERASNVDTQSLQ